MSYAKIQEYVKRKYGYDPKNCWIACLMLVVSIAFAGCYDVEIDKITGKPISDNGTEVPKQNKEGTITQAPYSRDWWGDWESFSELIQRIERVEEVLSQIEIAPRQDKALLARITDLETSLESQKAELRTDITKLKEELSEPKITPKQDKALLARITDLETALESQKAELRADITKLKEELPKPEGTSAGGWFTSAAIATIISALIAGGVAVHMSRKDTLSPKTP
ncbi:MAG: hypothetical protein ISS76_15830 [Phycisphaerae bacterium]|nr:hypothetical protein [Phycisphaerae bacterium]